jgi:hypothetical protein
MAKEYYMPPPADPKKKFWVCPNDLIAKPACCVPSFQAAKDYLLGIGGSIQNMENGARAECAPDGKISRNRW